MDSDLTRFFSEWNTVLAIIGGCSCLAIGIFIERLLTIRKSEIDTSKFILSLRKVIRGRNIVEAVRISAEEHGRGGGKHH